MMQSLESLQNQIPYGLLSDHYTNEKFVGWNTPKGWKVFL
jgi:hypothetical protein